MKVTTKQQQLLSQGFNQTYYVTSLCSISKFAFILETSVPFGRKTVHSTGNLNCEGDLILILYSFPDQDVAGYYLYAFVLLNTSASSNIILCLHYNKG